MARTSRLGDGAARPLLIRGEITMELTSYVCVKVRELQRTHGSVGSGGALFGAQTFNSTPLVQAVGPSTHPIW